MAETMYRRQKMITIYRSNGQGLEEVERVTKGCWINMIDPSAGEIQQVAGDLEVEPELLKFPLARESISRAEKVEGGVRILVRIPHHQRARANLPYVTLPLGVLVTDGCVVTLCRREEDLLRDLDDIHREMLTTSKPQQFVLLLLWSIANSYIRYLGDINQDVDRLEDQLQRALQNREVLALLRFQKSLVFFTTALEINEMMLERLKRADLLELNPAGADLLDDVTTETQEARTMSQIASDILSQMMDAFASIISNNLNVVMKFLASITVILIIPQVIASFYGMNVGLPISDHPLAFYGMVSLSALLALIIGFIFWRKKWL
jgi:magnesium transporter